MSSVYCLEKPAVFNFLSLSEKIVRFGVIWHYFRLRSLPWLDDQKLLLDVSFLVPKIIVLAVHVHLHWPCEGFQSCLALDLTL